MLSLKTLFICLNYRNLISINLLVMREISAQDVKMII